ncbi:nitroreductase family protein [Nisaea sp.]|uniref:nitroreductase family protein n=1 Tax=Nisaea sp. TaxID=2024842 RepID=UPI003B51E4DA
MPDSQQIPSNDVIDTLLNRVSVRKYTDAPVSEAMVETILKTAFRAPTSSNIQSYSVVVVRDQEKREALAAACGGQRHIAGAPVFLAFCADLTRIEDALVRNGHSIDSNNLETGLVSAIDAALVGMSAYLVADSLGIKGVMIGGARNKPVEVARILGLPQRVFCVFGMCLGWPAEAPAQKPRMDYDGLVHFEEYGKSRTGAGAKKIVDDYDVALAEHYRGQGRQTTDASWSDDMDKKFHPWLRDDLRERLKELGFDFR